MKDTADRRFMQVALQEAETALSEGQMPFGAAVADARGRLLGKGHNRVLGDQDPAAHGEIMAIRDAWRKVKNWESLAGSSVYTSCEPCLMCTWVITQMGARRVVFAARGSDIPTYRPLLGSDFGQAARWLNSQPDWEHIEVIGDLMRPRAARALAKFPWKDQYARKK